MISDQLQSRTQSSAGTHWYLSPNVTVIGVDDGVVFVNDSETHELACGGELRDLLCGLLPGDSLQPLMEAVGRSRSEDLIAGLLKAGLVVKSYASMAGDESVDRNFGWLAFHHRDPNNAQRTLRDKTVAIVGVGGIGTHVLEHLCGAGVRNFILIDDDRVERNNLNRQYLFTLGDVGRLKVEAATHRIGERDNALNVAAFDQRVRSEKDLELLDGQAVDFVVLSADTPTDIIDRAVANYCSTSSIPWMRAGVGLERGFWGPLYVRSVTTCPTCFERALTRNWTEQERQIVLRTPAQTPYSLGAVNATIASLMARDIILYLIDGESIPSLGSRVVFDLTRMKTACFSVKPCHCWPT